MYIETSYGVSVLELILFCICCVVSTYKEPHIDKTPITHYILSGYEPHCVINHSVNFIRSRKFYETLISVESIFIFVSSHPCLIFIKVYTQLSCAFNTAIFSTCHHHHHLHHHLLHLQKLKYSLIN